MYMYKTQQISKEKILHITPRMLKTHTHTPKKKTPYFKSRQQWGLSCHYRIWSHTALYSGEGLCGDGIREVEGAHKGRPFRWSGQHGSELWIALNAVSSSQMVAHVRIALPI